MFELWNFLSQYLKNGYSQFKNNYSNVCNNYILIIMQKVNWAIENCVHLNIKVQ